MDYHGCAICGTKLWHLLGHTPEDWQVDTFALHGPTGLSPEADDGYSDELLTWYDANVKHARFSHLEYLAQLISHFPTPTSSYFYRGFHKSCASIAHQFITQQSPTNLDSFCDIWFTLNHNSPSTLLPLDHRSYYLPNRSYRPRPKWWKYDPFDIPDLTSRLLENVKYRLVSPSAESSRFCNNLSSLPQELLGGITDYLQCTTEPLGLQPTYLLPQHLWKQLIVKIPFIWDIDAEQLEQPSYCSIDSDSIRECDWELLFR
ncbi:unnamed protein product [Fusarium graminearum]|uniref:Uncharacterized protein n=1 Tax=Gibberella zeae TaxID=5518 RepID=A0A4E9E3L1_GIBZA|nr:unnamed protein product [Fusarium graminearum]